MARKRKSNDEKGLVVVEGAEIIEMSDGDRALEELQNSAITDHLLAPISTEQLNTLWEKTPRHAIRQRQGGGGKIYKYVPHGYVEYKLNRAFRGDWDFELIPAFSGSIFHLQMGEVINKNTGKVVSVNYSVCVLGRLTVRLRDPDDLAIVIGTIVKSEVGSAAWYPENEFGDALKAAASDALKRCGLRWGIALDLYYDDDRAQQQMSEAEKTRDKLANEIAELKRQQTPKTTSEVILRVKEDYHCGASDLFQKLYSNPDVSEGIKRLENDLKTLTPDVVWFAIKKIFPPEASPTATPPPEEITESPPTEEGG